MSINTLNTFSSKTNEWFYYLMNKDKIMLEFKITKGFDYSINEVNRYTNKLPIGFLNISDWVHKRQAPKHREYIENLLKLCQINNIKDFISITYALSLNDCFWVKPKEPNLYWKDVSLYQNDFNDSIAKLSFNGEGLHGIEVTTTSPEFGTDGSFAKCWVKNDKGIQLLKRGSQGFVNAGLEPYSEYYSSQISEHLCDSCVTYDLLKFHNDLACSCKLFSNESIGYVPILNILGKTKSVDEIIAYFDSIGSGELFRSMIVLDGVTMNTDRHLNNYGVLFDNETLEVKTMAPVFDNNMALLPYAMQDDFDKIEEYLDQKGPKFGGDWVEVAAYCLTPRLKSLLNNLYGFKFIRHKEFNLDEDRVETLNKIVNNQIKKILEY